MSDRDSVGVEVAENGVATVTLNRPQRLNSFDEAMPGKLLQAVERLGGDEAVRCLVITGAGRAFSAGQDLSQRRFEPDGPPPDLGDSLERRFSPLIRALSTLEKPVIASVNGVAAGAGVGLALACDLVLAARSARFLFAFSRIGLVPDASASWQLAQRVGHARALGVALLGESVEAERAEQWGLIWRCVDDDSLHDETAELAARLARAPTRGLVLTRRLLVAAAAQSLDAQLDLERDIQREAGRTDDYREGVAAFMEKREPHFRGR